VEKVPRSTVAVVLLRGGWHAFVHDGGWKTVALILGLIGGSIGIVIYLAGGPVDKATHHFFWDCLDRRLTKYAEEHHVDKFDGTPDKVWTDAAQQCADELDKRRAQTETK
jgi:hypothetical protein